MSNLITDGCVVYPWHCDRLGHMNVIGVHGQARRRLVTIALSNRSLATWLCGNGPRRQRSSNTMIHARVASG
jgi:hypothetical protein